MAEIHFCGRREAQYMKGPRPWDAIVSINDPDEPTPPLPPTERVMRLEFYDIPRKFQDYIEPRPEHVQALLDLARDLTPDSRVLVHCHAGISRSAAAAIILAIALGNPVDEAITRAVTRPNLGLPNRLLLQLAEEPLGVENLADRAWAAIPDLKKT